MERSRLHVVLLAVLLGNIVLPATGKAEKPWERLIPFKRVEAKEDKSYRLTKDHGPWLILATSFVGEEAERQARELVLDLRRDFKLQAYYHDQMYDFTQKVTGLGLDRYGGAKKMRYANAAKFTEVAVLVGHFPSVDDPRIDKTLKIIRHAQPGCLVSKDKKASQRFASLREFQKKVAPDAEKRQRGPMGNAFVTRNPLLPQEYFVSKGLDPLVESMNRDAEYSLLKNRGQYTVRVASFRGASTMKVDEIKRNGVNPPSNKLEEAALKAHELTAALRKQGVEAYEFHDRYESIVTVGSFESVGQSRPDGKTEINPRIHAIMQTYGPERQPLPGQTQVGLVPRALNGISFDVQPMPVEVPKKSLAAAYAPNRHLFP